MNGYGFVGPHLLVSAEFWSGFVVGVVALAGALAVAGTWVSERQEGGPPSARVVRGAGVQTTKPVRGAGLVRGPVVWTSGMTRDLVENPRARKPAKPRKRVKK